MPLPAKETVTVTVPVIWSTDETLHDAVPAVPVVALQLWAELPVPSVRTTGWPLNGVPLLVSSVDRVSDWPLVAVAAPV